MQKVILRLPDLPVAEPSPVRRAIRRWSRGLELIFSVALGGLVAFALVLSCAVLLYDGPLLSFGPGGIWIGQAPNRAGGLLPLTDFSFVQRLCGAMAVVFLTMPVMFIAYQLRRLFRLYGAGIVFAEASARHLKLIGVGLLVYALAPFVANRSILLAGVNNDLAWFHLDDVLALVLGVLFFVAANVTKFGREIERERDGFV